MKSTNVSGAFAEYSCMGSNPGVGIVKLRTSLRPFKLESMKCLLRGLPRPQRKTMPISDSWNCENTHILVTVRPITLADLD